MVMDVSFLSGRYKRSILDCLICDTVTTLAYPWIRNDARSLDLNNFLDEFDGANAYAGGCRVHPLQDIRFDRRHGLPGIRFRRDSLL